MQDNPREPKRFGLEITKRNMCTKCWKKNHLNSIFLIGQISQWGTVDFKWIIKDILFFSLKDGTSLIINPFEIPVVFACSLAGKKCGNFKIIDDYSGVPIMRAGCNKRAGWILHDISRNKQVVLSEQGGIFGKQAGCN